MSANAVIGTFPGTGTSAPITLRGGFNTALWGAFVGTVVLEQSYDGGVTWLPVSIDGTGTANAYTGPHNIAWVQPERDVQTRFRCSAFTSGPINYRISGDML
jgi:hypothetical protein